MAFCRECGKPLPEGAARCPECGAAAEPGAAAKKKKKPLSRRWWVWAVALLVLSCLIRGGAAGSRGQTQTRGETVTAATTAAPTAVPTAVPTTAPTATAVPQGPGPDDIRPEVREFLDSYEACMDEYVEFMQKYMKADTGEMMEMMGDYYSILARYTEFSEKLDRLDESQLTDAEMAYYIEVTGRVSQKLLSITQ